MSTVSAETWVNERMHQVARHWRELTWLRGLGTVLMALAIPLTIWLTLDLFLNFPSGMRYAGLLVSGLSGLFALYFALLRPLMRGISASHLIHWLEAADPRLQERLLTSVELANASETQSRVGRLMQQQIRRETQRLLKEIDPAIAIPPDRAYRILGLGLLATALCVAPFVIWLSGYGLGWQRLAAPSGNWGWGRNYRLEVKSPPLVVARGSDVPLVVTATRLRGGLPQPKSLTVQWRPQGAAQGPVALSTVWEQRRLTWSEGEQAYLSTLPRIAADTEYVIVGAAAESPRYRLQVVEPPRLLSLSVSIAPPGYTGLPSADQQVGDQLMAPIGSELIWKAVFDRPIRQASLDWPTNPAAIPAQGHSAASKSTNHQSVSLTANSGGRSFTGRCRAIAPGLFVMRWISPEGFQNEDPPRPLIIQPDAPPVVKLEGPSSLSVHPQERHQLSITASDDYGLTRAELWIEHSSKSQKVLPLALQLDDRGRFQWTPVVDLAEWKLESGQSLRIRARVIDNCDSPAPQEQWSESQVLVLNSSAPSAQTRELASQTQEIRQDLQELMRDVTRQRADLRAVHQKTAVATVRQKDAAQEQRLAELEQRQKELSETLDELRNKIPQTAAWDEIARRAEKSRETEFKQAERQLAQAQKSQPRERIEQLSRALDDLGTAQKNLQQLDDMVRSLANEGNKLDELARLANQSERLAEAVENKRAAATQPEGNEATAPSAETGELQTAAEELNEQFNRLLEKMTDLKQAREASRQQREQAASEAFSRLAEEQRQLSRSIARTTEAEIPSALQPENTSRTAPAAEPSAQPDADAQFRAGQSLASNARQLADRMAEMLRADPPAENRAAEAAPRAGEARPIEQSESPFDRMATAIEQANFQEALARVPEAREELSRRPMPEPTAGPGNPSNNSERAGEGLAGLNEELNRLEEQLAQAAEASAVPQQRGALAAQQERIERQTREVGQQAAPRSATSSPSSSTNGSHPAPKSEEAGSRELLEEARRAMEDVRQSLAQADSPRAESAAETAAQTLERLTRDHQPSSAVPSSSSQSPRIGEQVERAEQSLSEGRRSLSQSQSTGRPSSPTSERPGQSRRQGSPGNGQPATDKPKTPQPAPQQPQEGGDQLAQAANNFRSAAAALRQIAQSPTEMASTRANSPGSASPSPTSSADPAAGDQPNDGARFAAAASLEGAGSKALVGSKRVWGRLTGTLQTDILDSTRLPSHPEYRRQIQHYFQEIARTVSQPAASTKPGEVQP